MNFDTDALAVWINGLLVLALVSGVLAIAAMVLLLVGRRSAGGPVPGPVHSAAGRLPEITMAHARTTATDQAA